MRRILNLSIFLLASFAHSLKIKGANTRIRTAGSIQSFANRRAISPSTKLVPSKGPIPQQGSSSLSPGRNLLTENDRDTVSERTRTLLHQSATDSNLVGEDSAAFSLSEQSLKSWGIFGAAVATVLSTLFYVWIYDDGFRWGDQFRDLMENLANGDSTLAITYMLGFFAVVHSGLASLRPTAEEVIGARAWRVIFAMASLPLAFSCIVYFINHRYDGLQLWDLRTDPAMHSFVWITSFLSFFFLYPSTFNLLEVAAVDKPKLHLWETGVIRITRHPQMVGQVMWCAAHTAYIGTSFMCATSAMLCLHHLFAVWNGDRRLQDKWGDKALLVRERTSVVPFAAIFTGKQVLPEDYYKEWLRAPYLTIALATTAAYFAHPYMQAFSTLLHW